MAKIEDEKFNEDDEVFDEEADEECTETGDVLKDMVSTLNELPTEVLEQLLKNLDELEEWNKNHPEAEFEDDEDGD